MLIAEYQNQNIFIEAKLRPRYKNQQKEKARKTKQTIKTNDNNGHQYITHFWN